MNFRMELSKRWDHCVWVLHRDPPKIVSGSLPLSVWMLMYRYKLMTPSDTGFNDRDAPLWTAEKLVSSVILVTQSSVMKSLKNSTGGHEWSRLVFSSLGPVLEEVGTPEIPLQSQLYPLNRRVDLTKDRRHCAQSLDLDLADPFHPTLHHFHNLCHFHLHLKTP